MLMGLLTIKIAIFPLFPAFLLWPAYVMSKPNSVFIFLCPTANFLSDLKRLFWRLQILGLYKLLPKIANLRNKIWIFWTFFRSARLVNIYQLITEEIFFPVRPAKSAAKYPQSHPVCLTCGIANLYLTGAKFSIQISKSC